MTLSTPATGFVSRGRFWAAVTHLMVAQALPVHEAIASAMLRWTGRMGAALEADATATYTRFREEHAWTVGADAAIPCPTSRTASPDDKAVHAAAAAAEEAYIASWRATGGA